MVDIKWIVFDADNTLWDVEYLYDEARDEFCKYTLSLLDRLNENPRGNVDLDLLEKAQRRRDLQLYKTHSYSSARFARSFEDTLMFFLQYPPPEAVIHVRHIAQDVFEKPVRLVNNLKQILDRLSGKYCLGIITAGERWVQEKRMAQFHLRDRFKEILIVEKKTADVFKAFCVSHDIEPKSCWVVGDSIRSDVLPAIEAGLRAIHVQASNWIAEHEELPADIHSVKVLREILEILA